MILAAGDLLSCRIFRYRELTLQLYTECPHSSLSLIHAKYERMMLSRPTTETLTNNPFLSLNHESVPKIFSPTVDRNDSDQKRSTIYDYVIQLHSSIDDGLSIIVFHMIEYLV